MDSGVQVESRRPAAGIRLTGRAPECAAVDRLIDATRTGGPGVAHGTGEPGHR